jgi:nitrogen fixation NifU-like protein
MTTYSEGDLGQLYRDIVLDHSRHPRNFRSISGPSLHAQGDNALCGDRIRVEVAVDGTHISDAAFEATGCAISMASASIMTEMLRGLPVQRARDLAAEVEAALTSGAARTSPLPGDLAALAGVRAYPSRIRCALLPWRTLRAALDGEAAMVSTESGN